MKPRDLLGLLLRVVIGGVLIYSGLSKAVAPAAEFAAALAAYELLPTSIIQPTSVAWPWLELVIGTYILFGYYTRFFSGVAGGMFLIFLTVLITSILRNIDPGSCGCFGAGITLSIRQTAFLDAGLLLSCIALTVLAKRPIPLSTDSWIAQK
jgi:uncharacterized membrane protein YphA (DoxX/SURF4 family)